MMRPLTRRRFLKISAAAGAGLSLSGAGPEHTTWSGSALGADAQMIFANCKTDEAEVAIAACRAEIVRLERIFSLYDGSSEITRLNHTGVIAAPSADFLQLMQLARWFAKQTCGAFDCTVQPLWKHLVDHYRDDPHRPAPPPQPLDEVLRTVGYRELRITPDEIALPPGGSVTLNGIAQGYITDRIAGLLEDMDWRDVLVGLGEFRALRGRAWPVRIAGSRVHTSVSGQSVATSAGSGTPLNMAGDRHHLIDPRTGINRNHFKAVTVVAQHAVTADALSTALAVAAPGEVNGITAKFPRATVYIQGQDGQIRQI